MQIKLLRTSEPKSDGNYLPALQAAERLLLGNTSGSCALLLLFLSDGKPSDQLPSLSRCPPHQQAVISQLLQQPLSCADMTRARHVYLTSDQIQSLASRFGRRLSVHTIGFAGSGEDFSVLKSMSTATHDFGSLGGFQAPSLAAESLSFAIASVTSTLTSTRTEMTELGGTTQRTVRDVRRESRNNMSNDLFVTSDWTYYPGKGCVWRNEWSMSRNRWVAVEPITANAQGNSVSQTLSFKFVPSKLQIHIFPWACSSRKEMFHHSAT